MEESCDAEHRLHAALMDEPRRAVAATELEALRDPDARDNYRILLGFRDRLIRADALEACYACLFQSGNVDVPPLFIEQLAHVILRNALDGCEEPLRLRGGGSSFANRERA